MWAKGKHLLKERIKNYNSNWGNNNSVWGNKSFLKGVSHLKVSL